MNANKTIGAAKYLKKSNLDYIPFRINMRGANCSEV